MYGDMEAPGALSVIQMNQRESDTFIDYMNKVKPNLNADLMGVLFGENLLKVFDVFAGQTLKYPDRKYLVKIIGYVRIYEYCKSRNFSDEAYSMAAKVFKRRKASISRIVKKVESVLNSESVEEEDE